MGRRTCDTDGTDPIGQAGLDGLERYYMDIDRAADVKDCEMMVMVGELARAGVTPDEALAAIRQIREEQ